MSKQLPIAKASRLAASWLFERQSKAEWWHWSVLTHHNPDPETLGFDEKTPFMIFSDFAHQGLLSPVVVPNVGDALIINTANENLWKLTKSPWKWWIRINLFRVFEWLLSGIIGAIIGIAVSAWWEKLIGRQ